MDSAALETRYRQVLARIRGAEQVAGRLPGEVRLIAVSKRHPAAAVYHLMRLGQRHFGESYVQEAVDKMAELAELPLCWHFIGPIQSNKTRQIAAHFDWVHSLDREKIAARLNAQRPDHLPPLRVLLQVNVSGEAQKAGVAPERLPDLARAVLELPRLQLMGLMALPRKTRDPARQAAAFAAVVAARQGLNRELDLELPDLSMGMSGDLEAAIAQGATWVRVGEDIFGPRG